MFHRKSRQFAAWVLAMIASALLAVGVAAQAPADKAPKEALFGDANISVELLADGLPRAGEEWMLALRFKPSAPEWHGYWSNPGDAGQGMRLMLDLPPGWVMGDALYPVPERLLIGDLMNHVYEGEYTVLVPVRVPEDAVITGVPGLSGYVDFLACTDRVCVPQDAVLTASVGLGDFAKWRAQVAPPLSAATAFGVKGTTLRLAIPLPASVSLSSPHVFVANENLVNYAAAQTFRRDGDMLIVEIPLAEYRGDQPSAVGGILSFGGEAGAGVKFDAIPGDVPTGGTLLAGPAAPKTPPLWTLILGALAGGLILNIMPCVFPILSLKALSLARAGESEGKARAEGIAYTAGVVLACVGLGAVMLALRAAGEQVGWAFQLQEPSS